MMRPWPRRSSFDRGTDLAEVPFERVVELVPSMSRPQPFFSMLNFFDPSLSGAFPLQANFLEQYHVSNLAIYTDGRVTYPVTTLVGRFDETVATVLFPKNPVARESVTQNLEVNPNAFVCALPMAGRPRVCATPLSFPNSRGIAPVGNKRVGLAAISLISRGSRR